MIFGRMEEVGVVVSPANFSTFFSVILLDLVKRVKITTMGTVRGKKKYLRRENKANIR